MSDEELDYTRIIRGLVSVQNLKSLKEKYSDKEYMIQAINEKLKEEEKA